MPIAERRAVVVESAERLQLNNVIVEKDFWVRWILSLLFGRADWRETFVFKGGTALSKVFGIIRRFSEDIDLSVAPATLGISEGEINEAGTRRKRDEWMNKLEVDCAKWVEQRFQSELEGTIRELIGERTAGERWLEFQIDKATHSSVLLFRSVGFGRWFTIHPQVGGAGVRFSHRSAAGRCASCEIVARRAIAEGIRAARLRSSGVGARTGVLGKGDNPSCRISP